MFKKLFFSIFAFVMFSTMAFGLVGTTGVTNIIGNSSLTVSAIEVPTGLEICGGDCPIVKNPTVSGDKTLQKTISEIVIKAAQFLTFIGVSISIVYMVWGGYKWMDVNDPKGAETGQKIVTNAAIGLVVIILAYTIVGLITTTLQTDINLFGGNEPSTTTPPANP
jgi:hypothetical protein